MKMKALLLVLEAWASLVAAGSAAATIQVLGGVTKSTFSGQSHGWNWEVRKIQVAPAFFMDVEILTRIVDNTKANGDEECTQKDPWILVHGWGDSRLNWVTLVPVFQTLKPTHAPNTIVIPSLRGHGDSQIYPFAESQFALSETVLDLVHLLDQVSISKAVWIGHSLGGSAAIHAANHFPARVSKVVLMDSILRLPQSLRQMYDFGEVLTPAEKFAAFDAFQREEVAEGWISAEFGVLMTAENMKATSDAIVKTWFQILATDLRDAFRGAILDVPTLLICGEKDFLKSNCDEIASMIGAANAVFFEDVGHDPHYKYPQRVATAIAAFVATDKVLQTEEQQSAEYKEIVQETLRQNEQKTEL